jgi:hypothetical protein
MGIETQRDGSKKMQGSGLAPLLLWAVMKEGLSPLALVNIQAS